VKPPLFSTRAALWPALRSVASRAALASAAIALSWWLPASAPLEAQNAATVELLAAGDLRGEIKPCGCSPEGQFGGLLRRLTFLEQAIGHPAGSTQPILVDLGNNFPDPSDQGQFKVDLIQSLLKQYPPAAILVGTKELTVGIGALDPALPYLLSNDALGKLFKPYLTVLRGTARIGIYGFLSPAEVYQEFSQSFRVEPLGAEWLLGVKNRIATERHAKTVLLFRGSDSELAQLAASGLFDRIIVGNPSDDESNQIVRRRAGDTEYPQVPTKGQGFVRVPLSLDPKVAPSGAEVVWLSDKFTDHSVAVHELGIYDDKVKGLFFARLAATRQNAAESLFAGAPLCATCHVKSAKTWNGTRHAHALATLERVKKNFDPECLTCHVVGLGQQGFLSAELTPNLGNVQCENCHGPGKAHAADPVNVKPDRIRKAIAEHGNPESVCRVCHHGSHSPKFDFPVYWPKIAHGKE
jgi:hypothetical protein